MDEIIKADRGLNMIYVYRILWLLFYIPTMILAILIFFIGIPVFIIAGFFWYVKTGDVNNTPQILIVGVLSARLICKYKDLEK